MLFRVVMFQRGWELSVKTAGEVSSAAGNQASISLCLCVYVAIEPVLRGCDRIIACTSRSPLMLADVYKFTFSAKRMHVLGWQDEKT